jgi:PKD repeat protein
MFGNNFGSPAGGLDNKSEADDWLISPEFSTQGPLTGIDFEYYENFGDTLPKPLTVYVTNSYTGDPRTTAWTEITPAGLNGSTSDAWIPVSSDTFNYTGNNLRVAFHYQSAGTGGGTTKRLGVDKVCVASRGGPLEADFAYTQNGGTVSFIPDISGGVPPYDISWIFGDSTMSGETAPVHDYTAPGVYTVSLTVSDQNGTVVMVDMPNLVTVSQFIVPSKMGNLRVATFNAALNRGSSGDLAAEMAAGTNSQIKLVAETIQRANPDVILINEYDQIYSNGYFDRMATEQSILDFKANYLEVAQADDTMPVYYDYFIAPPTNTGVPAGYDFNNNGRTTDPDDAYGFGEFAGKYGFIILSKYPIKENQLRTFQKFLWKDMPDALLPEDPDDTDGDGDLGSYYNADELAVFRLSSKNHVDVPVLVPDLGILHILGAHPTPPVFDDGTAAQYPNAGVADWNGLRNHDEIRFWADYVDMKKGGYIYDDTEWDAEGGTPKKPSGGLKGDHRFVVVGDQNADPIDGDATFNPIQLLLNNSKFDTSITPTSTGALQQVPGSFNQRETKTATFWLRADYALPSSYGLDLEQAFVMWPRTTDLEAGINAASDHRMVVVDIQKVEE